MKTTLFYFSGTGNSLKVAKDLANRLGDTDIIPIPKAINQELDLSADRIGIVFPVYMWGMPLIVRDFLKKLRSNKYTFTVATYGGAAAGALNQVKNELLKYGTKLKAGFLILMPGNYIPMRGAQSIEKQQKQFTKEENRISEIAEIVKVGKESKIEAGSFIADLILTKFVYNMGSKKICDSDKQFWVNNKCTSCGICEKVCPVDNIIMVSGKPVWQHKCQQCMACIQWCPEEAIEYGKKTQSRKRYRNPYVKVNELIY